MSKKTTPTHSLIPEWSLKVDVARLGAEARRIALTADAEQARDLARRLKVNEIKDISGEVQVRRKAGSHMIHVSGRVEGTVTQSCVVTLEPVVTWLGEDIDAWYSDEEQVVSLSRARREQQGMRADAELEVLPEEEDPEAVVDGAIDIGELATQYLSLAVDPYPRSEAARKAAEAEEPAVISAGTRPNPFAALKDWKAGRDGKK